LEAVNTLQINAENSVKEAIFKTEKMKEELGKYYTKEYIQTRRNMQELTSFMNTSIRELKRNINDDIQTAIDNLQIDTTDIQKVIDKNLMNFLKKTENDLLHIFNNLDNISKEISSKEKAFKESAKKFNDAVDDNTEKLNNAIENFNKKTEFSKTISISTIITSSIFSIILGFLMSDFLNKKSSLVTFTLANPNIQIEDLYTQMVFGGLTSLLLIITLFIMYLVK
jgi:gas vesicle protein